MKKVAHLFGWVAEASKSLLLIRMKMLLTSSEGLQRHLKSSGIPENTIRILD